MWLRISNGYLNLGSLVDVHSLQDIDGVLTVTVETVAGNVKHYKGREAEALKDALDALANGSLPGEIRQTLNHRL
jgi:hypothetical protein